MKPSTPIMQLGKGLINAGLELSRSLISMRTLDGLLYSLYRYPVSSEFKRISKPRDGRPFTNGACIVFSPGYCVPMFGFESLPPYDTHRFASIYRLLLKNKTITPEMVYVPDPVSDDDLVLVHGTEYIQSFSDPEKVAEILELPLIGVLPEFVVNKIVSAFKLAAGGTILSSNLAIQHGFSINLGGGFHHAKQNRGDGFCIVADIAIAIQKLINNNKHHRSLVVDLDVHQGDGTIACTAHQKNTFTFSMHQAEIFPFPKEVGNLDVTVPSGADDNEYLKLLKEHLPAVIEKSRPDIVFYLAGADVLMEDPLASINLSSDGLMNRDQIVVEACRKRGIPISMTLAGGYSQQAVSAQYKSIKNLITNC